LAEDVAGSVEGETVEAGLPARRWSISRFRIPIACAALVVWLLITTSNPFNVHTSTGLVGAVADGPQWGILFAGLFLIVLTWLCRWHDLGLNPPASARNLLLLWLPAIYLLIFVALDFVAGPPPLTMVGFMALNIALGAFSEEMMFRGVLFAALRTRLAVAPAVIISSVLFGFAHLVNIAVFGNLQLAGAQAVAAAMSGVLFMAIRLRTGSLIPAIVYHALWDFTSLMAVTRLLSDPGSGAGAATAAATSGGLPIGMLVAPIALLLPNFLYALFLLRKRKDPVQPVA